MTLQPQPSDATSHGLRSRVHTGAKRRQTQLLITDVDNTLYDFGEYFEAGLEGLVKISSTTLSMSETAVLSSFRQIFTEKRSIEYPFALEHFDNVKSMRVNERRDFLQRASAEFWDAARRALNAYPGVLDTLKHLTYEGVQVVAFTDAPIHEAVRRLRALGVDKYLSGLVATEWFGRRPKHSLVLKLDDVPGFIRIPRHLQIVGRLTDDERKPNPHTYAQIMNAFNARPENVTVIGDSPTRDLEPAAAIGARAVWARYGRRSPAQEILLQQVVPFRLPEINHPQDALAADFLAVDGFEELLTILPTQQILPLA